MIHLFLKVQIVAVLLLGMKVRNRAGFLATLTVFCNTLYSLGHPRLADRGGGIAAADPAADWGSPADLTKLDVKW